MIVQEDIRLERFEAWYGAKETHERLIELDKCDIIENYIIEMQTNNMLLTSNQINDFLRFEIEYICMLIDISIDEFELIGV